MYLSLDTEVAGLHRSLLPFMVTGCNEDGDPRAYQWPVNPFTRSVEPPPREVNDLADYIEDQEVIFHHGQFDILKFANLGLRLSVGNWTAPESRYAKRSKIVRVKAIHETMLMSHLVDSRGVYVKRGGEAKSSHALKELCLVRLGVSDQDEIALRKAVQSARLKADKLGWKIGATIDEDYWLPRALWKFQQELHQTRVVNCKTNEYDVLIDRTTEYGNPFKIGKDGNRDKVIKKFADNCPDDLDLYPLVGKRLGCHCKPLDCHGDVYVEKIHKQYGKLNVPPEWEHLCRDYAIRDVRERTMSLFLTCQEILQKDDRWEMYLDEMSLIPIYYMLEETGLRTNAKVRKTIATNHQKKAIGHETKMKQIAKAPNLNIDSDPQLRKLLFDDWKLTSAHLTPKKKEASVNAKALEGLRDYLAFHREKTDPKQNPTAYEFLTHLIGEKDYENSTDTIPIIKYPGYRQHIKYLGYLDFYTREAIDDIFHATIFPTGTGTTRISTKGSQNVGKKKVDGVSLRNAFGPQDGWIWASIDYEQLELRIFAAMANDQGMIDAFNNGYDFHSYVATCIFNLPPEKITTEQRRIAKNTVFAIIYGGSPWKVDYTAGMKGAYDLFSKQFPSAKRFMDETIDLARSQGYILTADGYPLYAPPSEPFKATDYRIQGTAGRIIKLAMKWLVYGKPQSASLINWSDNNMFLQIHDELLFAIDTRQRSRKDTVRLVRQVATIMEQAGQSFGITTPVSCSIHKDNWGDSISLSDYAIGV